MKKIALTFVLALVAGSVFAHGGNTDAGGCHTEKKTGVYHCH